VPIFRQIKEQELKEFARRFAGKQEQEGKAEVVKPKAVPAASSSSA
jgi:hypothetical protein